jgi:hypothetical protein
MPEILKTPLSKCGQATEARRHCGVTLLSCWSLAELKQSLDPSNHILTLSSNFRTKETKSLTGNLLYIHNIGMGSKPEIILFTYDISVYGRKVDEYAIQRLFERMNNC